MHHIFFVSENNNFQLVEQLFRGSVNVPAARWKCDSGRFPMHTHVFQTFELRVEFWVGIWSTSVRRGPVLSSHSEKSRETQPSMHNVLCWPYMIGLVWCKCEFLYCIHTQILFKVPPLSPCNNLFSSYLGNVLTLLIINYLYFTVITKLHYRNIGQILHVKSNGDGVGH
jgi:hypothetical protein